MANSSREEPIAEDKQPNEPNHEERARAWHEMQVLAREVAGAWKSDLSAVEAVREQRR